MTPIDANRESLAISRVAQLYAAILALHRARIFRPDRALIPARLGEMLWLLWLASVMPVQGNR